MVIMSSSDFSSKEMQLLKSQPDQEKHRLQEQQQEYANLQRELADAISRLAPLDDIRIILASGAKVDGPVTHGLHPIHYAAYQNFIPAVRLLVLRGCNINAMDDNGITPVHLAAERGYYDLLKFLIANGAKVCFTDVKKEFGSSSLDEPLTSALRRDNMDCAELLLKNGANPNARHFLGSEINLVSVLKVSCIKLLLDHGADPNTRDRTGLTPLMKAARHPQGYASVKLLIDHGADVNDIAGERHDYRTVLHHSIFSGNIDLIRLILISGAQYPKLDFDKPSPMDIAIISGRQDIARLLIEFNADVNAGSLTTIGQPLHTALTQQIENKYEMVKLLLDSGADLNSRTTSNRNTGPPLHDYLHSLRRNTINQLSTSSSLVNSRGGSKTDAAELKIVRLLLKYGARVILRSPSQHPLGLIRTLERIHDEDSLDLLHLLIKAAEDIDWFLMSKIIYSFLRHANRSRANELFDPSVSSEMTPQRLQSLLSDEKTARNLKLDDSLAHLLLDATKATPVLSLKQISRIEIRKHMSVNLKLRGHRLIASISDLPIPAILRDYMVYQD